MNMKKILLASLSIYSLSVIAHPGESRPHADYSNGCFRVQGEESARCPEGKSEPEGEAPVPFESGYTSQGQQAQRGGSAGEKCLSSLQNRRTQFVTQQEAAAATPATQMATIQSLVTTFNGDLSQDRCRNLEVTAMANGGDLTGESTGAISQDRRITCRKEGDFTLDWKSCKAGLDAYNMIVVADAALDVSQRMRTQQNNERMNQEMAARSAQGDTQNAALDATIQANNSLSGMNQEKAAAYMAAVGLLGSKISAWQGKSDGALAKLCATNPPKTVKPVAPSPDPNLKNFLPEKKTCLEALQKVRNADIVFANESAKSQLISAFMQYMQKAVAAGMAAKNLANIAKRVEQVKQGTESPDAPTFDKCVVAPNDPSCLQPGSIVPGQEYTGGNFSVDGLGNNVFGLDTLENQDLKLDDPNNLTPVKIGDAGSPFVDKAKEADGIMDPAPVASTQPGAAPTAGAGGGGGGSGGGGGGVSLGNDLAGPEAEKPSDVKANQVGGAYNFTGGQGFKAIAATKDENPFSSLFDSKSQGGLEEDRSIASDDIGGKDSGLFKRISTRYGKVQSDKRIEALNLE